MTKQQIEICKKIQKYPRVKDLFAETGIKNYEELGEKIPTEYLNIKHIEDDERAELHLKVSTVEILENYCDTRRHLILTEIVSVVGLVLATLSLIWQVVEAIF